MYCSNTFQNIFVCTWPLQNIFFYIDCNIWLFPFSGQSIFSFWCPVTSEMVFFQVSLKYSPYYFSTGSVLFAVLFRKQSSNTPILVYWVYMQLRLYIFAQNNNFCSIDHFFIKPFPLLRRITHLHSGHRSKNKMRSTEPWWHKRLMEVIISKIASQKSTQHHYTYAYMYLVQWLRNMDLSGHHVKFIELWNNNGVITQSRNSLSQDCCNVSSFPNVDQTVCNNLCEYMQMQHYCTCPVLRRIIHLHFKHLH